MIDFIQRVIVTQKSTTLLESERYTFDVDVHLKKTDIKALVEDLYGVQVVSVNTHRLPRRTTRFGGLRPRTKRAIIYRRWRWRPTLMVCAMLLVLLR